MTGEEGRYYPPLTPEEMASLETIVVEGPERFQKRAMVVTLGDSGVAASEIGKQVGLSRSSVYYWLRQYRVDGMAIFVDADTPEVTGDPEPAPGEDAAVDDVPPKDLVSIETLCERYSVDMAHVVHVAELGDQLFDALLEVYGLSESSRLLLHGAAMLHSLGYKLDASNYHELGRDIVLNAQLEGFSKTQREVMACVIALSRKKAKPKQEPLYAAFKKSRRREVVALAACLRVANGLDYSFTQTSVIESIQQDSTGIFLQISGDYVDLDAVHAEKAADLWLKYFGVPLKVRGHLTLDREDELLPWASLEPATPMGLAGRTLLEYYMLAVEDHAEALRDHQDDALTRFDRELARLQGLFSVFGEYYDATILSGIKKDVRWLVRQATEALAMRSVVILARTTHNTGASFDELRATWEKEAQRAMRKLRKSLESERYQRLLTGLLRFCRDEKLGAFPGNQSHWPVNTQAGALVWDALARLRAHNCQVNDPSICLADVRHLNNMLHYFGTLFGTDLPDALAVVQPVEVQFRDMLLGVDVLAKFEAVVSPQKATTIKLKKQDLKRLRALEDEMQLLITAQKEWLQELRSELVRAWQMVNAPTFRHTLASVIADA